MTKSIISGFGFTIGVFLATSVVGIFIKGFENAAGVKPDTNDEK